MDFLKKLFPTEKGIVPPAETVGTNLDTRIPKEILSSKVNFEEFQRAVSDLERTGQIEKISILAEGAVEYMSKTREIMLDPPTPAEYTIQEAKLGVIQRKYNLLTEALSRLRGAKTQTM